MAELTELAVIEVNNLIPVAYAAKEAFFLNENHEVDNLVDKVVAYYSSLIPNGADANTEDGRKILKKFAAEINNQIKKIDDAGKSVKDILVDKPKKIDASRRIAKDRLGKFYDDVRAPVLEYEAEQARIKAEKEAELARIQKEKDDELARLQAAEEQRKRDEQIQENARIEAERQAQQQIIDAKNAALKAEQDKQDAIAKAEKEKQEAIKKINDEAARKEKERQEEIQRKADEEAKRLSDEKHVKSVKNGAFDCLVNNGIVRDTAIKVVILICENKINNVSIKY